MRTTCEEILRSCEHKSFVTLHVDLEDVDRKLQVTNDVVECHDAYFLEPGSAQSDGMRSRREVVEEDLRAAELGAYRTWDNGDVGEGVRLDVSSQKLEIGPDRFERHDPPARPDGP